MRDEEVLILGLGFCLFDIDTVGYTLDIIGINIMSKNHPQITPITQIFTLLICAICG